MVETRGQNSSYTSSGTEQKGTNSIGNDGAIGAFLPWAGDIKANDRNIE